MRVVAKVLALKRKNSMVKSSTISTSSKALCARYKKSATSRSFQYKWRIPAFASSQCAVCQLMRMSSGLWRQNAVTKISLIVSWMASCTFRRLSEAVTRFLTTSRVCRALASLIVSTEVIRRTLSFSSTKHNRSLRKRNR